MTKAGSDFRKPWSLYLDLQISQGPQNTERGTTRYCLEHARALIKRPGLVSGIGLNPIMPFPGRLPGELLAFANLQWSTAANFRRVTEAGPAAFHMMSPFLLSQFDTLFPPYASRPEIPLIVTLVDTIPFMEPDAYFSEPNVVRRCRARLQLIRHADLVLAISEKTRQEAIDHLDLDPDRVFTIGSGVSPYFHRAEADEDPRAEFAQVVPKIDKDFILYVTGPAERKNTERLIQAFSLLSADIRAGLHLVLVGRIDSRKKQDWLDLAESLGLAPRDVILTGLIPDPVLRALYQTARLFVFPSLHEGFGLPVLEAAACGCPVLVAGVSSMPEILQYPPATFDPTSPPEMAAKIEKGICDSAFRDQLDKKASQAAARNSWEAVAERTETALRLLPQPDGSWLQYRSSAQSLQLAFVGDFFQSDQQVGALVKATIRDLSRECAVDFFDSGPQKREAASDANLRHFRIHAFDRSFSPTSYDAIFYLVENSNPDPYIMELAFQYPGILWPYGGNDPKEGWNGSMTMRPDVLEVSRAVITSSDLHGRLLTLSLRPHGPRPPLREIRSGNDAISLVRELHERAGVRAVPSADLSSYQESDPA